MRVRLEPERDVGWVAESESEAVDEPLENDGDIEGRTGASANPIASIERLWVGRSTDILEVPNRC
jgi:hypothetical protein